MSDWVPLYISLAILFIIGGFVPLMISGFIEEDSYNQNSFVSPIIDLMNDGFGVDLFWVWEVDVNPFDWFGDDFKSIILNQLHAFSYVPNYLSIPLLVISLFGFIYTFIKILPFT